MDRTNKRSCWKCSPLWMSDGLWMDETSDKEDVQLRRSALMRTRSRSLALSLSPYTQSCSSHSSLCTRAISPQFDQTKIYPISVMASSLAYSCSAFVEGQKLGSQRWESKLNRNGNGRVVVATTKCVASEQQMEEESKKIVRVSGRRAVCALIAMGGLTVNSFAPAAFGLLESDDDDALLLKVKEDKKKRIERRSSAVNVFKKEIESVQAAVYKLSETGQAIDNGDLNSATSVLATEWINDVKAAVSKVSSSKEEKSEAETFSSALNSLQAAVKSGDADSSRNAFVTSASSLEKWTRLSGLSEEVVGL